MHSTARRISHLKSCGTTKFWRMQLRFLSEISQAVHKCRIQPLVRYELLTGRNVLTASISNYTFMGKELCGWYHHINVITHSALYKPHTHLANSHNKNSWTAQQKVLLVDPPTPPSWPHNKKSWTAQLSPPDPPTRVGQNPAFSCFFFFNS